MSIKDWYESLSRNAQAVIIGAVISAVIAGGFGVVVAIIGRLPKITFDNRCQLSIDDVRIEERGGLFPNLELNLRNSGKAVCLLSSVSLQVQRILPLELPPKLQPNIVRYSWASKLQLSTKGVRYAKTLPLSVSVKANDVERLAIPLGCNDCDQRPTVFIATLSLGYNKQITDFEKALVFYMPPSELMTGFFDPTRQRRSEQGLTFWQLASANRGAVDDLQRVEGVRSPHISYLLSAARRPINFFGEKLKLYDECIGNAQAGRDSAERDIPKLRDLQKVFGTPPDSPFLGEALEHFENALAACHGNSHEATVLDFYGIVELVSGEVDSAEGHFRAVAERFPKSEHAEQAGHFSRALRDCRSNTEGIATLRKALLLTMEHRSDEAHAEFVRLRSSSCESLRGVEPR